MHATPSLGGGFLEACRVRSVRLVAPSVPSLLRRNRRRKAPSTNLAPSPIRSAPSSSSSSSFSSPFLPVMSSSSLSSATNNTSTSSSAAAAAKAKKHLDHSAAAAAASAAGTIPGSSSHHVDNSQSSSRSSSPSSGHPACAACKYQRRKCTPECLLAPHFPANLQRQFLNAHRLFGVKNILRIIKELDPVERTNAMQSIIYESNMRASDPVGGCLRVIQELERQLQRESMELALVAQQLSICRAQAGAEGGAGQTSGGAAAVVVADLEAANPCNLMLDVNDVAVNDGGDANYMAMTDQQLMMQQQYCNYFYNDPGCDDNNNINVVNGSNSNSSINNNNDNKNDQGEVEMQVQALSILTLQQQQEQEQEEHGGLDMEEEEEVKPPADLFETRPTMEDEQDSNNHDVNTTGESFPACRLGLGFSCY